MRRPGLPGLTILTIINRLWKPEAIRLVSTRFPISRSLFVDPAMTFETHLETFAGLPVIDFRENTDWQGPAHCYRVHLQYEDPESVETILDRLLAQAGDTGLKALIIGAWNGALEGDDSAGLVSSLVSRVGHLAGLKALFLGEIDAEKALAGAELAVATPGRAIDLARGARAVNFLVRCVKTPPHFARPWSRLRRPPALPRGRAVTC